MSGCSFDPLQTHSPWEQSPELGPSLRSKLQILLLFSVVSFLLPLLQRPVFSTVPDPVDDCFPTILFIPPESPAGRARLWSSTFSLFSVLTSNVESGSPEELQLSRVLTGHQPLFRDRDPNPRTTETLHSRKHQSCKAAKSSGF